MELIFGISNLKQDLSGSVVTMGNFDGLHNGHKEIIKKVIDFSKEMKVKSVAFTFFPHPQSLFSKDFKIISTLEQKVEYFRETGLDYLIIEPFTPFFANYDPFKFVEYYIKGKFKASKVVIGYDFSFGNKGEGNAKMLKNFHEFETEIVSPISVGNLVVHSTMLRNCLTLGDMELYKELSGRYPKISGHVVSGKGIGNKLGFATANINFPANIIRPAKGVYLVRVFMGALRAYGITNIGKKPTFGVYKTNAEVHLFNFNENIYGKKIEVELIKYIRPETRFDNIDDLVKQVNKDIILAKELINSL